MKTKVQKGVVTYAGKKVADLGVLAQVLTPEQIAFIEAAPCKSDIEFRIESIKIKRFKKVAANREKQYLTTLSNLPENVSTPLAKNLAQCGVNSDTAAKLTNIPALIPVMQQAPREFWLDLMAAKHNGIYKKISSRWFVGGITFENIQQGQSVAKAILKTCY